MFKRGSQSRASHIQISAVFLLRASVRPSKQRISTTRSNDEEDLKPDLTQAGLRTNT